MLTQTIVAVLVGFAIGVPTAFWLLKKVRIKARVRHLQVSLALGLPIALFVFLLQTSFAVPVFVITVIISLFAVALELTLRRLIANSLAQNAVDKVGKIGSGVDFEEARAASGCYPDDYMTKAVWLEMQEFMKSRSVQKQEFKSHQNNKFIIKSFEMHKNIRFDGKYFSLVEGIRTTTDLPSSANGARLFLFGASIVLCEEVPDRLTNASILQRILNTLTDSYQVINCGASGATTIDRTQMLKEIVNPQRGDIIVFYFGGADAGWIDSRSGRPSQELIWLPLRVLRALSELRVQIARWVLIELSPLGLRKFSRQAVADTVEALNEVYEYCFGNDVGMIAVLSPNIYTLRTKTEYENKLEKRFSRDMRTLISQSYQQYEAWVKTVSYGVSATHIFNNAPSSVFLDWAHVNARGNELIAEFIFEELKRRELIGDEQKRGLVR